MSNNRHLFFPPKDPAAESICTLDRDTAARRAEPPDRLLAGAVEAATDNGIE